MECLEVTFGLVESDIFYLGGVVPLVGVERKM